MLKELFSRVFLPRSLQSNSSRVAFFILCFIILPLSLWPFLVWPLFLMWPSFYAYAFFAVFFPVVVLEYNAIVALKDLLNNEQENQGLTMAAKLSPLAGILVGVSAFILSGYQFLYIPWYTLAFTAGLLLVLGWAAMWRTVLFDASITDPSLYADLGRQSKRLIHWFKVLILVVLALILAGLLAGFIYYKQVQRERRDTRDKMAQDYNEAMAKCGLEPYTIFTTKEGMYPNQAYLFSPNDSYYDNFLLRASYDNTVLGHYCSIEEAQRAYPQAEILYTSQ